MTPLVAKQLIDDVIVRVDGAENVREFFRQSTPNLLSHQTLSCLGRKEPYVSGDKRYGPGLPAIPKCRRRTYVVLTWSTVLPGPENCFPARRYI
jgi:hypothetical protein